MCKREAIEQCVQELRNLNIVANNLYENIEDILSEIDDICFDEDLEEVNICPKYDPDNNEYVNKVKYLIETLLYLKFFPLDNKLENQTNEIRNKIAINSYLSALIAIRDLKDMKYAINHIEHGNNCLNAMIISYETYSKH